MGVVLQIARARIVPLRPLDRLHTARRLVAAASVEDAEQLLEQAASELEQRRSARRRRRLGVRVQPRCRACKRFVANPALPCRSCGYLDGYGYSA